MSVPSAGQLPRAARILDAVTIALVVLGLSLVFTGGFRTEVLGIKLSVTAWWRPVLVALLLTAGRHWRWRAPRLSTRLAARGTWWRRPDARAAFPVFLATRIGVLAVGLLGVFAIGYPSPEGPPLRFYESEVANLPVRWDAGWYHDIAENGYRMETREVDAQQNIAFFPAYPMLMRYTSVLVGHDLIRAGMVISLASFLGALLYLYRLARLTLDDERAATALALIATYPFAVFYSAVYTESLFLLGMVATWYHYQRSQLWPAAAWGLLVGLTRPNGCFLSVPLGLMAIAPLWRDGGLRRPDGGWAVIADRLVVAAMPGIGMLVYSAFIYDLTGDPLEWAKLHAAWGRSYVSLDTFVATQVETVNAIGLYGYAATRSSDFVNALGVVFMLGTAWPVFRRFGLPAALLILLTVLPPLANGGFLSMGRVTSVLFPSFLWLAAVLPPRHRVAWIAVFAMLQGFVAIMFFTWRPLF